MSKPVEISDSLSAKMANMGFFASVLVVLMHAVGRDNVLSGSWVAFFVRWVRDVFTFSAVPYFFIASGFFLAGHCNEKHWWKKELRKRIKTLIIPYFLWVGIGTMLDKCPIMSGLGFTFGPPKPTHIWFLRALIMLVVASPIIYLITREKWVGIAALIFVLMGAIVLPTNLFLPPLGCFCFALGLYLRLHPVQIERGTSICVAIICCLLLISSRMIDGGGGGIRC